MSEVKSVIDPAVFYDTVDFLMWEFDMSMLDAIVAYCDRESIEIETVIPLVKRNEHFRSGLLEDGERLNILEKRARLPL